MTGVTTTPDQQGLLQALQEGLWEVQVQWRWLHQISAQHQDRKQENDRSNDQKSHYKKKDKSTSAKKSKRAPSKKNRDDEPILDGKASRARMEGTLREEMQGQLTKVLPLIAKFGEYMEETVKYTTTVATREIKALNFKMEKTLTDVKNSNHKPHISEKLNDDRKCKKHKTQRKECTHNYVKNIPKESSVPPTESLVSSSSANPSIGDTSEHYKCPYSCCNPVAHHRMHLKNNPIPNVHILFHESRFSCQCSSANYSNRSSPREVNSDYREEYMEEQAPVCHKCEYGPRHTGAVHNQHVRANQHPPVSSIWYPKEQQQMPTVQQGRWAKNIRYPQTRDASNGIHVGQQNTHNLKEITMTMFDETSYHLMQSSEEMLGRQTALLKAVTTLGRVPPKKWMQWVDDLLGLVMATLRCSSGFLAMTWQMAAALDQQSSNTNSGFKRDCVNCCCRPESFDTMRNEPSNVPQANYVGNRCHSELCGKWTNHHDINYDQSRPRTSMFGYGATRSCRTTDIPKYNSNRTHMYPYKSGGKMEMKYVPHEKCGYNVQENLTRNEHTSPLNRNKFDNRKHGDMLHQPRANELFLAPAVANMTEPINFTVLHRMGYFHARVLCVAHQIGEKLAQIQKEISQHKEKCTDEENAAAVNEPIVACVAEGIQKINIGVHSLKDQSSGAIETLRSRKRGGEEKIGLNQEINDIAPVHLSKVDVNMPFKPPRNEQGNKHSAKGLSANTTRQTSSVANHKPPTVFAVATDMMLPAALQHAHIENINRGKLVTELKNKIYQKDTQHNVNQSDPDKLPQFTSTVYTTPEANDSQHPDSPTAQGDGETNTVLYDSAPSQDENTSPTIIINDEQLQLETSETDTTTDISLFTNTSFVDSITNSEKAPNVNEAGELFPHWANDHETTCYPETSTDLSVSNTLIGMDIASIHTNSNSSLTTSMEVSPSESPAQPPFFANEGACNVAFEASDGHSVCLACDQSNTMQSSWHTYEESEQSSPFCDVQFPPQNWRQLECEYQALQTEWQQLSPQLLTGAFISTLGAIQGGESTRTEDTLVMMVGLLGSIGTSIRQIVKEVTTQHAMWTAITTENNRKPDSIDRRNLLEQHQKEYLSSEITNTDAGISNRDGEELVATTIIEQDVHSRVEGFIEREQLQLASKLTSNNDTKQASSLTMEKQVDVSQSVESVSLGDETKHTVINDTPATRLSTSDSEIRYVSEEDIAMMAPKNMHGHNYLHDVLRHRQSVECESRHALATADALLSTHRAVFVKLLMLANLEERNILTSLLQMLCKSLLTALEQSKLLVEARPRAMGASEVHRNAANTAQMQALSATTQYDGHVTCFHHSSALMSAHQLALTLIKMYSV